MAGRSLRSSKLRSFLTLLGIILSTTTLIAVMSVIHGMNVYIADKIADLGSDGFTIQRWAFLGDFTPKKFLELQKKNPELSREEYEFLKANSQYLSELGMGCETSADVEFGSIRAKDVNINGGTANLNLLSNLQTESGRYFSAAEDANRKQVAFIGQDLVEQFFTGTDPVGKTIRIDGLPFEVIGVGKKVGSVFGQSQDNYVHVPVETFFKMYGSRRWIYYQARALDRDRLPYALDEAPRAAARIPPRAAGARGQLRHGHLGRHHGPLGPPHRRHRRHSHCRRLRLHGRRRRRDHEHHAGRGHRAHAGDRRPQIARRAAPRHPQSVPRRIGRALRPAAVCSA